MSKQNFYSLLTRYRNGTCTDREKRLVAQWFALLDEEIPDQTPQETKVLEDRLWKAIQKRKQKKTNRHGNWLIWWKSAAAFVVFAAAGWAIYRSVSEKATEFPATPFSSTAAGPATGMTVVSSGEKDKTVHLPDGSEILLAPNSSLEYPAHFRAEKREVALNGKAFFKVTGDPNRPFLVYSGEIVTRVLGTSFWVDGSDPVRPIEVSVVTGKVTVSKRSENGDGDNGLSRHGVILTANQKASFSNGSRQFELGLVEQPVLVVPESSVFTPDESFNFEDTPATAVIEKLESAYGIEIILENEALKGCLFRGDISHQPLFIQLDLLCSASNATYEIIGTRVLISGKPCD